MIKNDSENVNDYSDADLQFPARLSVPGCYHYCKHNPEGLQGPFLVPCVSETMGKELSFILGTLPVTHTPPHSPPHQQHTTQPRLTNIITTEALLPSACFFFF